MNNEFQLIDKEAIGTLSFPSKEVLDEKDAIIQRKNDLDRALSLGNLEHVKIKIFFEDDESKKIVDTTVWGVTDKNVMLKQGVMIPIHRIYKLF